MSLILSGFTLLFAALSVGLPYWTVDKVSVEQAFGLDGKAEFDYNAGVWGICQNLEADLGNLDATKGQCYLYHTSKTLTGFTINGGNFDTVEYSNSLCGLYDESSQFFEEVKYFGLGEERLFSFLKKTCGAQGKATLALTVIALILVIVMGLMLLLGVTCCKKNSFMNVISMWLGVLGFIASVAAFATWIDQASPLKGSFSWGFAFMIITACFYAFTTFSVYRHVRKAKFENKPNHELEEHLATSAPMPAQPTQGTNLV